MSESELPPGAPPPLQTPPPITSPAAQTESSGIEIIIPYTNPLSLWSYYLGIFSALPVLGAPMGVVAVVLGVKALRRYKADPRVRGKTHAWVGIVCGGLFGLVNLALAGMFVAALVASSSRR